MADKKDLEGLVSRIESAVKAGHAADPKKKAALVRDLQQLKAGLKKELHGPLDDLLDLLEEDTVGLEASHPTFTAFIGHVSRLLASIGI